MKFIIKGGKKVRGSIAVSGNKNAATPIIAATLLTPEECIIDNVPRIADVEVMLSILVSMGATVRWSGPNQVTVCTARARLETIDYKLMKRLRSSVLLLGPFLVRFHQGEIAEPGGCIIGNRPLDTHFVALQKFGATFERTNGHYRMQRDVLVGTTIVLGEASVTATEGAIMAAALARGTTILKNAACEPHVEDVAQFLIAMGAHITGIGTSTITVEGVDSLHGAHHTILPDTIEAITFLILGMVSKSEITVEHARSEHMDVVLEKLSSMGARFDIGEDWITIKPSSILKARNVKCQPYPGIPTDAQALFGVLATQAQGASLIHETMYEGRLGYIQELTKMGANAVICDPHRVLISGPTPLYGQEIRSYDLRAGASLVIAGLLASGQTVIHDAEIIDRGYERIEERLRGIGADIQRVEDPASMHTTLSRAPLSQSIAL